MKYKAFIFDMDGTLVHTNPQHRHILVGKILKEFGKTASNKAIDRFWFETERDKIISEQFGINPDNFWEVYKKNDKTELWEKFAGPYEDIDFVKEIKEKGYKTGLVTGASMHRADFAIKNILGEDLFDAIVIARGHNGIKPKPHPHGLEECLSLLDLPKERAVYIGNAHEDVETARNAAVFSVLIDRGEYKFSDIAPDATITSLYQLRELFKMQ